tara:strand:+ start:253 stop:1035 length:783 start_codon:yes stop_codon:yes gene_type:complete
MLVAILLVHSRLAYITYINCDLTTPRSRQNVMSRVYIMSAVHNAELDELVSSIIREDGGDATSLEMNTTYTVTLNTNGFNTGVIHTTHGILSGWSSAFGDKTAYALPSCEGTERALRCTGCYGGSVTLTTPLSIDVAHLTLSFIGQRDSMYGSLSRTQHTIGSTLAPTSAAPTTATPTALPSSVPTTAAAKKIAANDSSTLAWVVASVAICFALLFTLLLLAFLVIAVVRVTHRRQETKRLAGSRDDPRPGKESGGGSET